jgi:hypothetical protein
VEAVCCYPTPMIIPLYRSSVAPYRYTRPLSSDYTIQHSKEYEQRSSQSIVIIIWNPPPCCRRRRRNEKPRSAASRRVSIEQHHSQQRSCSGWRNYRNRPVVDVDVASLLSWPIAPIASGKMKAITPSFIWDPHEQLSQGLRKSHPSRRRSHSSLHAAYSLPPSPPSP